MGNTSCCSGAGATQPIRNALDSAHLTPEQQSQFENRALDMVAKFTARFRRAAVMNGALRALRLLLVVSVLGLSTLLPMVPEDAVLPMNYSLICTSVLLSAVIGVHEMFNISWRYSIYWFTRQRLTSEIWQFITRSGRYRGIDTHQDHFPRVMGHLEDIKKDADNAFGQQIDNQQSDGIPSTRSGGARESHLSVIPPLRIDNVSGVAHAAEDPSSGNPPV